MEGVGLHGLALRLLVVALVTGFVHGVLTDGRCSRHDDGVDLVNEEDGRRFYLDGERQSCLKMEAGESWSN